MAEVLGRVTSQIAEQRGPDALHRIKVPEAWLLRGETVEIDLPRNLTCAACEGGGCDLCDRAGATSLRGREDPPESIEVTLPEQSSLAPDRRVVLRIPGHGGFPSSSGVQDRGLLLLRIEVGTEPDRSVRLVRPPRMSLAELALSPRATPLVRLGMLLGVTFALWLAVAFLLRSFD